MRGTLLVTGFIQVALVTSVLAGDLGLGLMVGEPTGVSLKVWSSKSTALDAAVGWSFDKHDWIYMHGDYLWHRYTFDLDVRDALPFYFGIGGRILLHEDHNSTVGVRVPLGLDYITHDRRFDFFLEMAPIINLAPDTEFDIGGGIGARFYF